MKIKFKTIVCHFYCTINSEKMLKSPVCDEDGVPWEELYLHNTYFIPLGYDVVDNAYINVVFHLCVP